MRVLVVEDERRLAAAVRRGLQAEGFAVDLAHDGEDGLHLAREGAYDALVLDLMLPKISGYRVCRQLRAEKNWVPILILSAKDGEYDQADGLDLGADDYLTKPFAFEELVARVNALARRAPSTAPVVRHGDLVVDRARRRVSRAGRPVSLTRKELGVLEELLAAEGAVVSAEALLERVWDEHADPFSRTVTVTLARLRRKLGPPEVIETVVGSGYRIP
jgi:DNA-binding response OmpR family regulator